MIHFLKVPCFLFPANPLKNPQDTRNNNNKKKHGHQEALTGLFVTAIMHENNTKINKNCSWKSELGSCRYVVTKITIPK